MMIRRSLPVFALGLALAACSSEAPPPIDANVVEAPVVEDMGFNDMVEPMAPPTATPTPSPTPEAPAEVEAQVQDDADAVGMTARVNRDGTTPAETTEAEVMEAEKK